MEQTPDEAQELMFHQKDKHPNETHNESDVNLIVWLSNHPQAFWIIVKKIQNTDFLVPTEEQKFLFRTYPPSAWEENI